MSVLVVRRARVWTDPDSGLSSPTTLVCTDGQIAEIGPDAVIPDGARVIDADGRVLTAGFWNCHVHLTEPVWRSRSTARLQMALDDMLLSRGFTSVCDLGSDPRHTRRVLAKIMTGELSGPTIHTAGLALYPHRALPFYVRESVPWFFRWVIPDPRTPDAARRAVRTNVSRGADLVKLFTGAYVERDRVVPMQQEIATAAVAVARGERLPVFAHPSDRVGTRIAVESGVDVLAHVPDETEGTAPLLERAAAAGMRISPTLHMFAATVTTNAEYLDPIDAALRGFVAAGGRVVFGTDVGYLGDYDTTGEYLALERCGLSPADILRTLTTEPAALLDQDDVGRVAVGFCADLTLLEARQAPTAVDFASVASVIRRGRLVWTRTESG